MDFVNNSTFKLALIQTKGNCREAENFVKLQDRILQAAMQGAQIIVLPELVFTDYFCIEEDAKYFDLAHAIDSEQMQTLSQLARERAIVLVVPFFEKRAAGLYHNSAAVFDADGSLLGNYRKMHIPDDPGFYEKYYFTPGDLGFKSFQTRYGKKR